MCRHKSYRWYISPIIGSKRNSSILPISEHLLKYNGCQKALRAICNYIANTTYKFRNLSRSIKLVKLKNKKIYYFLQDWKKNNVLKCKFRQVYPGAFIIKSELILRFVNSWLSTIRRWHINYKWSFIVFQNFILRVNGDTPIQTMQNNAVTEFLSYRRVQKFLCPQKGTPKYFS